MGLRRRLILSVILGLRGDVRFFYRLGHRPFFVEVRFETAVAGGGAVAVAAERDAVAVVLRGLALLVVVVELLAGRVLGRVEEAGEVCADQRVE